MRVKIGDKVELPFYDEANPYTVRARDDRYIICTNNECYFIVDLERQVRGADNMVFCSGYETDEDCQERLGELQRGEIEVSYRNVVPLDIDIE